MIPKHKKITTLVTLFMNPTIKSTDSSGDTTNNVIRSIASQCVHMYSTKNRPNPTNNVYAVVPDELIDLSNSRFL